MENSLPKVSVVIPFFNDGKYLNGVLKSIWEQPYNDIEVILADDGSTDPVTLKLLNEIKHPKVHVFFKEHTGVSLTRNFAINKAKGKYILPLDADDFLGEIFLGKAVKVLDENPEVKLVCGHEQLFGKRHGVSKFPDYSIEELLGQNIFPTTSLFRKSDFYKTSGFNVNMKESFEDWDFWLSLLETGGKVCRLDIIARYYRVRSGSRNFSLTDENLKRLRWQIYQNHKLLYAKHFFDPMKSFEYDMLLYSREYKLGKMLLKPLRFLYKKLH